MVTADSISSRRRSGLRLRVGGVSLFLVVVLVAAAGLGLSLRHQPTSGGTLVINLGDTSRFINPLLAASNTDSAISSEVFSGLTKRNGSGDIVPGLAQSWRVTDGGRQYIFRLGSDDRWSTGKPVTSYDVAYTYRLLASPNFPDHLSELSRAVIFTPTPTTVRFRLAKPDYIFVQQTTVGILPGHFGGSRWPIGSGPFNLSKVAANHILLMSYSSQAHPASYITRLSFGLSGSSDSPSTLSCTSAFSARSSGNLIPTTRMLGLALNVRSLHDLALRRAIIASVKLHHSVTTPIPTWPASPPPASLNRLKTPGYWMKAGGWRLVAGHWTRRGRRVNLRMAASTDPNISATLDSTVRAMRRAGFGVRVKRLPFVSEVRAVLYPRAFDVAMAEWDFGSPDYDPADFWATGASLNFGGLNDPYIDSLAARIPSTASRGVRDSLRSRIGGRLVSDGAAIGLSGEYYTCRKPTNLGGFRPPALVTDAGGLLLGEPTWYLHSKVVVRNPF